jgi:hypothetical protein
VRQLADRFAAYQGGEGHPTRDDGSAEFPVQSGRVDEAGSEDDAAAL